ncbi:hypothetical protein [Shimia sp. SDUM112013]|uniref:hypothetical protein n=1 Tax=Shimia sp. SDUM112013 TaxID=3136160 RepID=UPI0032EC0B49
MRKKTLERVQALNARGSALLAKVLEREAELRIARANYENRAMRLDRRREVFFPSLEDVAAGGAPFRRKCHDRRHRPTPDIERDPERVPDLGHNQATLPRTLDSISRGRHLVPGASVLLAVALAMILTAVVHSTLKGPKTPFYPTTFLLMLRHGLMAFGRIVAFAGAVAAAVNYLTIMDITEGVDTSRP